MSDFIMILNVAKAAAIAEANRIWVRDEMRDCGSCGGAILELDGRTKLAKIAVQLGIADKRSDGIYVPAIVPDGIRSQNADIPQGSMYAFKKVLEENGCGNAIKRFWTYVD